MCDDDLLFEIEEWRRRQPVIPTLAAATRHLLTCALQSDRASPGTAHHAAA